jgi:hypothetical protein
MGQRKFVNRSCERLHFTGSRGGKFALVFCNEHMRMMNGRTDSLVAIPNSLQDNDFWKCINSWKQNWNSRIVAGGNYFKGDHCSSKLN